MTKETLCTYEQCRRLKGLGFDWLCNSVYRLDIYGMPAFEGKTHAKNFNAGRNVSVPTQQVAHRWLREKKQLLIVINPQKDTMGLKCFNYSIFNLENLQVIGWSYELYQVYEEAMDNALDYAIEYAIIQSKQ